MSLKDSEGRDVKEQKFVIAYYDRANNKLACSVEVIVRKNAPSTKEGISFEDMRSTKEGSYGITKISLVDFPEEVLEENNRYYLEAGKKEVELLPLMKWKGSGKMVSATKGNIPETAMATFKAYKDGKEIYRKALAVTENNSTVLTSTVAKTGQVSSMLLKNKSNKYAYTKLKPAQPTLQISSHFVMTAPGETKEIKVKSDIPGEFNVIKNTTFVNEDSFKDVQTKGFSLTEGAGVSERGLAEATVVYDPAQIKNFAIEMPTGEIKPVEQFHKKDGGKGKPSLGKLLIPVAAGFGAYQIIGLGQNNEVKGESTYLVVSNEVPAEQNFLTTTNNPNYYVSEFPLKHPQGGGEVFVSDSLEVAEEQLEEEKDKTRTTDTEKKKDGIGYLNVEKKPPEDKTTKRGNCAYIEEKKDGSTVCDFVYVLSNYRWVEFKGNKEEVERGYKYRFENDRRKPYTKWSPIVMYEVFRYSNGGLYVKANISSLGERRWIGNNIERENEIQKSFLHKSKMCVDGKPPSASIDGNSVWYLKVKKLKGFENVKIDKLRIQFKTSHYAKSDAGMNEQQEKVVVGEAKSPN